LSSNRQPRLWFGVLGLALALSWWLIGCDYSNPKPPAMPPEVQGILPDNPGERVSGRQPEILANVIKLIDQAALKPGGPHFQKAAESLNDYFAGTDPKEYALRPEAREFVLKQLPEGRVRQLEAPEFTLHDARHMEDCMLYSKIAARVAGTGDDLSRVRRLFDWIVRGVQLVPAGSLGTPDLPQPPVRPFDALMRGMATEEGGAWAERGWLFMSLCRQLGIDVGLITYTPTNLKEPIAWITAALIDGKLYLFDARIGLAIPGPGGEGVATLDDALNDPEVLGRLDLPGQLSYFTTRDVLANSPSKIGILIDSSPGYISPRMKLLQGELAGKDRTILYRDPAEQRDAFVAALGARGGEVALWALPIVVETRLFGDPKFVEATLRSLALFDPQYPLLLARTKQLRGDVAEAISDYIGFRFNDGLMMNNGKNPVPAEIRRALDAYATYFLALSHLERDNPKQAEFFFGEALRLLPEPGPRRPYYYMFRWGAATNLARLNLDRGDAQRAVAYLSEENPTTEHHGNLLLARDIVWSDPTAPPPPPLPPAPSEPPPAAAPAPAPAKAP
jgi:hypothetical protein